MRVLIALGFFAVTAFADVTLTMDEVPTQTIDGLTVAKGGESFTFSDPLGNLFYNSTGPGMVTFVQDPSIQGTGTDSFSVSFSVPVSSVQFGLAELQDIPLNGANVMVNFAGGGSTIIDFDLPLTDPFTEGQFTYTGAAVSSILVNPDPNAASIAFDNLDVSFATVPEPTTISLLGIAACLGAFIFRRVRASSGQ